MRHSPFVSDKKSVKVSRNERRFTTMLTIPKLFSGNNAAARKLREQGMAELERELGPAINAYGKAITIVKSRFNSVEVTELAESPVSHGERTDRDNSDHVLFYVEIHLRARKGRMSVNDAVNAIKRRIIQRAHEYWDAWVNTIPEHVSEVATAATA